MPPPLRSCGRQQAPAAGAVASPGLTSVHRCVSGNRRGPRWRQTACCAAPRSVEAKPLGTFLGSSDAAGAAEQSAGAPMQPNGRLSHQPSLGSEAGKSGMLDVSAFHTLI